MPIIHLLRHAKSSWDDPTLVDHDRPLAPRGRRAARRMAAYLQAEGILPRLVLCSSARRARETLDALRPTLGDGVEVRVEDGLYGADSEDLLERLRAIPPSIDSVLLVGHNPGLYDLAVDLIGEGDRDLVDRVESKLPTGALASFDSGSAEWTDLRPGSARLVGFVVPKSLDDDGRLGPD